MYMGINASSVGIMASIKPKIAWVLKPYDVRPTKTSLMTRKVTLVLIFEGTTLHQCYSNCPLYLWVDCDFDHHGCDVIVCDKLMIS